MAYLPFPFPYAQVTVWMMFVHLLATPFMQCTSSPYGNARLTSKKGRLAKEVLTALRKKWRAVLAMYIDEVSMISSGQFAQCDVRMRQAELEPAKPFGGLAIHFCGDFLQLPPVDKAGDRKKPRSPN